MVFFKNENTQMFKNDNKTESTAKSEELTIQQKELVTLVTPIVQKYYKSADLSKEKVEQALTTNISELNAFLGKVLATITIQESQAQFELLDQADEASSNGSGFY